MSHIEGHNIGSISKTSIADTGLVTAELNKMKEVNAKLELLQQEMSRLIKSKAVATVNTVNSHSAYTYHPSDYSGNNLNPYYLNLKISSSIFTCCTMITGTKAWIINIDALDHVTAYKHHMMSICSISAPITVHLPNGSSIQVSYTETIALHTHMK